MKDAATAAADPPTRSRFGRIVTLRAKVPWAWVGSMMLPWTTLHYMEMLSGAPLTFTLRKFVEQPALIALLSSLNIAFNFMIGAVSSYMSDRIWTRWGRRRPFLLVGWAGATLMLIGIPLAPNLATLAMLILLYQFFVDVAKPYEPLYNEVIPPPQRGRASVLRSIATSVTGLLFNAVLIAQFDRQYGASAGGFQLRGEHLVYWTGAALTAAAALFLVFCVRETPPLHQTRERFNLGRFVRDVFGERRWWLVYLLYGCPLVSGAAINVFIPLTFTEQAGLTKAQFGRIEGLTMLASLLLFSPLAGFLADRFSRLRLLQISLAGTALVNVGLFALLRFAPEGFVTPGVVMTISLTAGMGGGLVALKYVIWGPLVYDFIPSDRFGTVSAGFAFVGGVAGFLMINLGGFWVQGFSAIFGTRSGTSYDYSSVFVLQFVVSIIAVLYCVYFERAVRRGEIAVYGRRA